MQNTAIKLTLVTTAIAATSLLAGCSGLNSLTESHKQETSYVIYDLKNVKDYNAVADGISDALKSNTSKVNVSQGVAPYPLPAKPGHFKMGSYGGSSIAALATLKGGMLPQAPSCPDALWRAYAVDNGFAQYGQITRYWACLFAYQGGYQLDLYTNYSSNSGIGSGVGALGAAIASPFVGTPDKFIPRTMQAIVDGIKATGTKLSYVASFPDHKWASLVEEKKALKTKNKS